MSSDISKKLVKSAVATVAAVVAIVITGTVLLMFEKIDVDIPAIQAVGSRIVVQAAEGDRPISVYIPDEEGNISSTPFKILSFTDTHFDTYRRKGRFTMDFLIKNIQIEKPDLVVIVGDVFASRTNRARVKQLCEVMEKLGVYWIPVLGNHEGDNLLSISREKF
ncbi:MAG: metallophosphoesterase family protein, partial [Christensenellales bacterium]